MLFENINIDITEDHIDLSYTQFEGTPGESKRFRLKYEIDSNQTVEDFRKDALKLLCEHLLLIVNPEDFTNLVKSKIASE